MKIVEEKSNGFYPPFTAIYPLLEQDDSTVIDDGPWEGEEMGFIEVTRDGYVGINYGWEDPPQWDADYAEKFALAILKAVEIARSRNTQSP